MKTRLSLLIVVCSILATVARAQDAKEGMSVKQKLFPNMKQDIDAINQRSAANDKLPITPANKRAKEVLFTDYKPTPARNTTAQTARLQARNAGSSQPSDKPAERRNDSIPAKIHIPDQGGTAPGKN